MQTFITLSKKVLKGIFIALFWLVVWQVIAILVNSEVLVPTPAKVLNTLAGLVPTLKFWLACLYSIVRVVAGFSIACLLGVLLALICKKAPFLGSLFSPILHIIRSTPVISFIILALVWIKTDYVPVFISFLMVVPIIYAAVQTGLHSVDRQLVEMAKVFNMKRRTVIGSIYMPAILPVVLSQGTVGLGFAWKSGIAAEVICLPLLSIGRQLKDAKAIIETPEVFAWTATVIVLSLILEWLLKKTAAWAKGRWLV